MFSKGLVVAALATAALGVVSCGSDDDSGGTPVASGGAIASELPKEIRSKGTLIVAADATYPPNEFLAEDGKTIVGMSPDLGEALEKALGIELRWVNASFDGILPGLAAGKYDIGFSSFTDTKEREQTVDFVTYYSAGTSFIVRTEDGPEIEGLKDLCGHTLAVQRGTIQADDAAAQATKCKSAGRPPLRPLVLPDQPGAYLALSSDRADVAMTDSPIAAYEVQKSDGRFKLVGEPYGTAPYGIAVPKGSGLAKPLLHAVQAIIRDGTYDEVLRKWGVEVGAIEDPAINGAVN